MVAMVSNVDGRWVLSRPKEGRIARYIDLRLLITSCYARAEIRLTHYGTLYALWICVLFTKLRELLMHRGMTTRVPCIEPPSRFNHFELRFTPKHFQFTAGLNSDFETNSSAASALEHSLPLCQFWGTPRALVSGLVWLLVRVPMGMLERNLLEKPAGRTEKTPVTMPMGMIVIRDRDEVRTQYLA